MASNREKPSITVPLDAGTPGTPIDDSKPDLKSAFDFYKNMILPRRSLATNPEGHEEWKKVEFGQSGGELYPVWNTSPWGLRDFGLGVAMYFQTLQLLAIVFFLCALFQIHTIVYYSGSYSDGQDGVSGMLRGSAICTVRETVCLDESCSQVSNKNFCNISLLQAQLDVSMTVVLFMLLGLLSMTQSQVSADLDESVQTAQDYSVVVEDPDPDAVDCDEWRDFFSQFGHVTFVTVALNNGKLLKLLTQRRAVVREIAMELGNLKRGQSLTEQIDEADSIFDSEAGSKIRRWVQMFGLFGYNGPKKLKLKLRELNEAIQKELDECEYQACSVFVIFETEQAQRRCLKALTRGDIPAAMDWREDMANEHIFRGTNVLSVREAPEVNEVFWEDLDVSFQTRMKQQATTLSITAALVIASSFFCDFLGTVSGANAAALWISLTNVAIPLVIKQLVFSLEQHVSLTDQQLSLFLKLSFFRWMNSAVVIYMITPFEDTLRESTMKQINAVLIADALTTPLIRALDPAPTADKLLFSRLALTQEKMNSFFLGTPWYAAERYADMTKTMFLALFYSSLLPQGLLIAVLAYVICYMLDKYSLLRSWRTPAELEDTITQTSRFHMALAIFAHVIMTMVFYAGFPFDNACASRSGATLDWDTYQWAAEEFGVTTDKIYRHCKQEATGSIFQLMVGSIPKTVKHMEEDQKNAVQMYGYLCLAMSLIILIAFFGHSIVTSVYGLFYANLTENTDPNDDQFSQLDDVQVYVPESTHPNLAYPLVMANIGDINPMFLSFEMEDESMYKMQNLVNEAEFPGAYLEDIDYFFSNVKHYPAPSGGVKEEKATKKRFKTLAKMAMWVSSPTSQRSDSPQFFGGKKNDYEQVKTIDEEDQNP